MRFCRNIPDSAKRILRELASESSGTEAQRVVAALASDERMEPVWDAVKWFNNQELEFFVGSAVLFAMPVILDDLIHRPEKRIFLSGSSYDLSFAAKHFADALEKHRPNVAEFWPESIEDLLQKLRNFSEQQFRYGMAFWSSLEDIPTPSRRGRGNLREIAYGNALAERLKYIRKLSREQQDTLIAVLTNVAFGHTEEEVTAETIRARRKRSRRKLKKG